MGEINCNDYFLSVTALRLWQTDDADEQDQMFICLTTVHKESFFNRVVYKRFNVPGSEYRELAETAFLDAWESFNRNGRAGKISIKEKQYTGYLFTSFKNNYLKLLGKEARTRNAEKEFGKQQPAGAESRIENEHTKEELSPRMQEALSQVGGPCKELLWWRYVENLSHEEIARRRNINHKSSVHMVWRCTQRFLSHWRKPNQ